MIPRMRTSRRTFLRQLGLGTAGLSAVTFFPACRTASHPLTKQNLPRSTPEAEGISSSAILAFLDAIRGSKHEFHSFMLMRHGKVVAEGWWTPYAPGLNHTMYSMSKSFTSTAVGFAVAEGKLRVEDKVISFFPEEAPAKPSDYLSALKVKDLLTMSVGNEKEPTQAMVQSENWVRTFLEQRITHPPGSVFMYNSGATYMLSAIVQRVTGQKVVDYLRPRLFDPLGIEGPTWESCPRGINVGGWGLSIRTEGLAKFGQLYLQEGVWHGRQILPSEWVREATTFKIQQPAPANPSRPNAQNDWLQGYCYQFWRCTHQAYRGDGAFGQYTIVLPAQDAVIAITSESPNMQGQLDLVWEHLLPAMKAGPLPADRQAQDRLSQALGTLSLPLAIGESQSTETRSMHEFKLEPNDLKLQSLSLALAPGRGTLSLRDAESVLSIPFGFGKWEPFETALPGTPPRLVSGGAPKPGTKAKAVASGGWKTPETLEILLRYPETPHHDTLTCLFRGPFVEVSFLSSIAQLNGSKDKRPMLKGEAKSA